MANAILDKDNEVYTIYPVELDNYFENTGVILSCIPKNIVYFNEEDNFNIIITSAQQYAELLNDEIEFWQSNDSKDRFRDYTGINNLKSAKSYFENTVNYFKNSSSSLSYIESNLTQSVNALKNGFIGSKTKLAEFLLDNKDKSNDFISGFMKGLSSNGGVSVSNTNDSLTGFIMSLQYRRLVNSFIEANKENLSIFETNINNANENYSNLNSRYTKSFHKHEERISALEVHVEKTFETLKSESEKYYQDKEERCKNLEGLYEEKLKLQAPAQYWDDMEKDYKKKGAFWLVFSVLVMGAIIGSLILILAYLPNLFSEDSHWIDVFKNSAIITVIMSIAVYVLRLFVKLSTSSYHLARDAKERSKLSYFYLALIEKNAITDKERAIVLNSLFSRADTGLLKGDSSPTMSGNVSDLIDVFKK